MATMLSLAGCGTSGSAINAGCEWIKPIFVSKDDVLTPGTARKILEHDEAWETNCG